VVVWIFFAQFNDKIRNIGLGRLVGILDIGRIVLSGSIGGSRGELLEEGIIGKDCDISSYRFEDDDLIGGQSLRWQTVLLSGPDHFSKLLGYLYLGQAIPVRGPVPTSTIGTDEGWVDATVSSVKE
jgi:hypothetical protein